MKDCGGYDDFLLVAEAYDSEYTARDDIDFWIDAARQSGGPVLEVGCGTGRVLIPVARAGIDIVGLDLSRNMLSVCRQKIASEPPAVQRRVDLVEADMRHFDLGRQFPLVTIPFRPFQHLSTVADELSCLKAIRTHLRPEGKLILDLFNPWMKMLTDESKYQEWGEEPEITMPDGRRVQRRFRIAARDYFRQVQDTEMIYYVTAPDGAKQRLVHAFPMRYLWRYEAEHLFYRCGFEVDALYAGFDKSEFGTKDPGELIFVARKAG